LMSKWLTLKTLFGDGHDMYWHMDWLDPYVTTRFGRWRLNDFLFVVPTLRFLGIAIVLAGFMVLWRRTTGVSTKPMCVWLASGLAGVTINALITWSDHVTFTQSYFTMLALLVASAFAILELPSRLVIIVA